MPKGKIVRLVETALLLGIATVLSFVKLVELPYGGSVTACSMLPVLLIGFRHGTGWGLGAGTVFSLIQLMLGASVLSYCPTALSVIAVIVLDYGVAFACTGLSGLFRRHPSQTKGVLCGVLLAGVLRYASHVISGCTVWAGLSIPTKQAFLYSLIYNATYMLPEIAVTAVSALYVSTALDLRSPTPTRIKKEEKPVSPWALAGRGIFLITAITDMVLVFAHLQDAETGTFAITGLAQINGWLFLGVTVAGVTAGAVLSVIAKRKQ